MTGYSEVIPGRFEEIAIDFLQPRLNEAARAADAAREVRNGGCRAAEISLGHRRCSHDPSQKNDAEELQRRIYAKTTNGFGFTPMIRSQNMNISSPNPSGFIHRETTSAQSGNSNDMKLFTTYVKQLSISRIPRS